MYDLKRTLSTCILFKDFSDKDITNMLANTDYRTTSFSKDQIIAVEGENISSIGIILEGIIEVQKNYPSGRNVVINKMKQGNVFGEVIIFSQMNQYPSTIFSTSPSKVMFISKPDIIKLCSTNEKFLKNFMGLLSDKILFLNQKVRNLSYQTIREKIANYLTQEYTKQKSLIIKVPFSRKEMAEQFGTTRPSLSRELINMKNEYLIEFNKRTITIKDLDALEDALF